MGEHTNSELRLSALRAFLGRVHPCMRLIKVSRIGHAIQLTVLLDQYQQVAHDDVSEAATEIVADFPGCLMEEIILVTAGALPTEDVLSEGWIYARAE